MEDAANMFSKVSKFFTQKKETKEFDQWSEIDELVSQLEEAREDIKTSQMDSTEMKENLVSKLNETREKIGLLKFFGSKSPKICLETFSELLRTSSFCDSESCKNIQKNVVEHKRLLNKYLKKLSKTSKNVMKQEFSSGLKLLKKGPFDKMCQNSQKIFNEEFLKQNNKEIEEGEKEISQMIEVLEEEKNSLERQIENFEQQLGAF